MATPQLSLPEFFQRSSQSEMNALPETLADIVEQPDSLPAFAEDLRQLVHHRHSESQKLDLSWARDRSEATVLERSLVHRRLHLEREYRR